MNLSITVKQVISTLGIEKLKAYQVQAIRSILDGQNVFVVLPTSFGKSLIYQVPQLVKQTGYTLVVEPTLALIHDQVQKLTSKEVSAAYITSQNKEEHAGILRQLSAGKLSFLYVTPEQLIYFKDDLPRATKLYHMLLSNPPSFIAVDEAHCVTTWGNRSFRPSYTQIGNYIDHISNTPPIIALTATAPVSYRADIAASLRMGDYQEVTTTKTQRNISILIRDCTGTGIKGRLHQLQKALKQHDSGGSVIVYCNTPKNVEAVSLFLSKHYDSKQVCKYHAKMNTKEKNKHEMDFLTNKKRIMVASSAFSLGVDKRGITLVIHFNLPLSLIDYYQQIGRAGRDGERAYAVLLYASADIDTNQAILQKPLKSHEDNPTIHQEVSTSLQYFQDFLDVLASDECIMQQIQAYLGYDASKACGHCTVCQRRKRK